MFLFKHHRSAIYGTWIMLLNSKIFFYVHVYDRDFMGYISVIKSVLNNKHKDMSRCILKC